MPTNPLADTYHLKWTYHPYTVEEGAYKAGQYLEYSIEVQWAKHTATLASLVEPYQIWHRSRLAAVAIDALRINEMEARISKVVENRRLYDEIALSERESHEIAEIFFDATEEHLHLNYDYIRHYIKDHSRSSLGGRGFKWRSAHEIDRDGWKQVLEMQRENLEMQRQHPTWYDPQPPLSGERARAEGFKSMQTKYKAKVDRTRVINFGNRMSLRTVFIPDKASWYQTILKRVLDVIQPAGEYYFPFMEGGHIYRIFSDLHMSDLTYHALDGRTWDGGVGIIMGPYFNSYLMAVGGIAQLPSGRSETSAIGSVGNIVATRKIEGIKCILGDDCALYTNRPYKTRVLEKDQYDTKFRFNLGMSFAKDPERPRICGFKISKDQAKAMISLQTADFREMEAVIGGKHSRSERVVHAGMFLGQFGSRTLLEAVEKLPPNDWKSPGELLAEMTDNEVENAVQWAEELGVENVFA
jgi:hypothetical protein